MYNFYPRTNYRHTLPMPGCISHLHAHPFPVFSLHHRGGTPELHFPESQAKEEIHYSTAAATDRQVRIGGWVTTGVASGFQKTP